MSAADALFIATDSRGVRRRHRVRLRAPCPLQTRGARTQAAASPTRHDIQSWNTSTPYCRSTPCTRTRPAALHPRTPAATVPTLVTAAATRSRHVLAAVRYAGGPGMPECRYIAVGYIAAVMSGISLLSYICIAAVYRCCHIYQRPAAATTRAHSRARPSLPPAPRPCPPPAVPPIAPSAPAPLLRAPRLMY